MKGRFVSAVMAVVMAVTDGRGAAAPVRRAGRLPVLGAVRGCGNGQPESG